MVVVSVVTSIFLLVLFILLVGSRSAVIMISCPVTRSIGGWIKPSLLTNALRRKNNPTFYYPIISRPHSVVVIVLNVLVLNILTQTHTHSYYWAKSLTIRGFRGRSEEFIARKWSKYNPLRYCITRRIIILAPANMIIKSHILYLWLCDAIKGKQINEIENECNCQLSSGGETVIVDK